MTSAVARGGRRQRRHTATAAQRHHRRPDALSVLTLYVFLLLAVPSDLGIAALGSAGAPSVLVGLTLLFWWSWHRVRDVAARRKGTAQPVAFSLAVWLMAVGSAYVAATLTALPPEDERATGIYLVNVASYAGVVLVAHDGLSDPGRFAILMRRISVMGGLYAALGLIQFFTGVNPVDGLPTLPGLVSSGPGGVDMRGTFVRPSATARHALEYASAVSMILPISVIAARSSTQHTTFAKWWPPSVLLLAAVLSVTRSALLAVAAGFGVLLAGWDARTRRIALGTLSVGLIGVLLVVPGLARTLMGMFNGEDSSVQSRTDSYDSVGFYWGASPIFGRGLGSLGNTYRIFDNQYLGLLIETGVVGLAAFVALLVTGMVTALASRQGQHVQLRGFSFALCGSLVAGALICAFFDAFHFPQAVGLVFLVIGLAGGLRTLQLEAVVVLRPGRGMPGLTATVPAVLRRWYVAAAVFVAAMPFAMAASSAHGVYYARVTIQFEGPPGATKNNSLLTDAGSTVNYAALIQRIYSANNPSPATMPTSAPLYGVGYRRIAAAYLPNSGGQWQPNFNKPAIVVEVVDPDGRTAEDRASTMVGGVLDLVPRPQNALGIATGAQIKAAPYPDTISAVYIPPRAKAALAMITAIAAVLAVASSTFADRLLLKLKRGRRQPPTTRGPS